MIVQDIRTRRRYSLPALRDHADEQLRWIRAIIADRQRNGGPWKHLTRLETMAAEWLCELHEACANENTSTPANDRS